MTHARMYAAAMTAAKKHNAMQYSSKATKGEKRFASVTARRAFGRLKAASLAVNPHNGHKVTLH